MGRVVAPYGIKGWIKVQPFTQQQGDLLDFPLWQLGLDGTWQSRSVESAKVHGATVVAKLEGIADREQAAALQGMRIAVSRDDFPAPAADEIYWADLIGLKVVNVSGEVLGTVSRVFETGANDVLVVAEQEKGGRERLLPYVAPVILKVDAAGGMITVDWGMDY